MVTETLPAKKRQRKNGTQPQRQNKQVSEYRSAENWPIDMEAAYRRYSGPYTIENAETLLSEEPLELYNGWLVWQEMTDPEERRVANNIQVILDLAARACEFGQAYPDQLECAMANGDEYKPDLSILSNQRYESQVEPVRPDGKGKLILKGSPELVVEIRSPSNRRTKEREKRKNYFENGALVIWDVDYKKQRIFVYEAENPDIGKEYTKDDEITCQLLFPGWKRKVVDFFSKDLSAEEIVGVLADQWRAEGELKGRAEGELTALRSVLLRQAQRRFKTEQLSANLEARLNQYNVEQLTELADSLALNTTLEGWLNTFPG